MEEVLERLRALDGEHLKRVILAYMNQAYALDTDTAIAEIVAWTEQEIEA